MPVYFSLHFFFFSDSLCLLVNLSDICFPIYVYVSVWLSVCFHPYIHLATYPSIPSTEDATCSTVRCWKGERCLTHEATGQPQCTSCEAIDSCKPPSRPVCASDGREYPSWCAFRHEACRSGRAMTLTVHHHCAQSEYCIILNLSCLFCYMVGGNAQRVVIIIMPRREVDAQGIECM